MALKGFIDQGAASRPAVLRRTCRTTRGTPTARPSTKPRSRRKWISRPRWASSSSSSTRAGGPASIGRATSSAGGAPTRSTRIGSRTASARCPITRTSSACDSASGSSPSGSIASTDQPARRRRERFLATRRRSIRPERPQFAGAVSAQVCFADPGARTWITGRLVDLIEAVHPDYMKWDNNFWINCNRAGHGHGAADGNFLHMRGVRMVRDRRCERLPGHGDRGLLERRRIACRSTCSRTPTRPGSTIAPRPPFASVMISKGCSASFRRPIC